MRKKCLREDLEAESCKQKEELRKRSRNTLGVFKTQNATNMAAVS